MAKEFVNFCMLHTRTNTKNYIEGLDMGKRIPLKTRRQTFIRLHAKDIRTPCLLICHQLHV